MVAPPPRSTRTDPLLPYPTLCRSGADRRIRYVRQPQTLGAAANFNLLARMSETPYFKWAAHDDLLAPGFLAACVEALDRDPAAVLASDRKSTRLNSSH